MQKRRTFLARLSGLSLAAAPLMAQSAYVPKQSDRPEPLESEAGFVSMFDGKSLKGWDGDRKSVV